MDELDFIIIRFINKKGNEARKNIIRILCMKKEEKLILLNYLYNLFINYSIIASDKRLSKMIDDITKEKNNE